MRLRTQIIGLACVIIACGVLAGGAIFAIRYHHSALRFVKLAQASSSEGRHEEAIRHYRQALEYADDGAERGAILRQMAATFQSMPTRSTRESVSRFNAILRLLLQAVRENPRDLSVVSLLLGSYYQWAQWLDSYSAWKQLRSVAGVALEGETAQRAPLARRAWAVARLECQARERDKMGSINAIRRDLRDVWPLFPDDARIPYALATCYLTEMKASLRREALGVADQLFDKACAMTWGFVREHPDVLEARLYDLRILWQMAEARQERDVRERAVDRLGQLEKILRSADDVEVAIATASLLEASDSAPVSLPDGTRARAGVLRAERLLRHELRQHPDDAGLNLALASNLHRQHRWSAAENYYQAARKERAIVASPAALKVWSVQLAATAAQARMYLDRSEIETGEDARDAWLKQAEALSDQLDDLAGTSPVGALLQGRLSFCRGRPREAVRKLDLAVEEYGARYPEAWLYGGLALAAVREWGGAAERLETVLQVTGLPPEQWHRAAAALLSIRARLRQIPQAVVLGRALRQRFPDDWASRLQFAQALLWQVFLNPGVTQVEDLGAGIRELLEPLAAAEDPGAITVLAEVDALLGDPAAARQRLYRHWQKHPGEVPVLLQLYRWCLVTGERDQASECLKKTLATLPAGEAKDWLQQSFEQQPQMTPSLESLLRVAAVTDDVQNRLGLYEFYHAIGNDERADYILTSLRKAHPKDLRVRRLAFEAALHAQQWKTAEELVQAAAADRSDTPVDKLWEGELQLAQGDAEGAGEQLAGLVAEWPQWSDAWVLRARAQHQAGDAGGAEESLRRALKIKPDHLQALELIADILDAKGADSAAQHHLRRAAIYSSADDPVVQRFLDYVRDHGNPADALVVRLRLAALRPWDYENRRAVAQLLAELQHAELAEHILAATAREEMDRRTRVFDTAGLQVAAGKVDAARQTLREHLDSLGERATCEDWVAYARFLEENGFGDEVAAAYREATRRDDAKDMPTTRMLASWLFNRGDFAGALACYQALQAATGPVPTYELVECLIQVGRPGDAAKELAGQLAGTVPAARVALLQARIAQEEGRRDEARRLCEEAVRLAPDDARPYFLRALLWQNEDSQQARNRVESDLLKAVRLDPDMAPAREALARLFLGTKRSAEAIPHLQRLVALRPESAEACVALARLLLAEQRLSTLETSLPEWQRRFPNLPVWSQLQRDMYAARGDWKQAAEVLAEQYQRERGPGVLHQYLAALLRDGQNERAAQVLAESADVVAKGGGLAAVKAWVLARTGDGDGATAAFRQAVTPVAGDVSELQRLVATGRALLKPRELLTILDALRDQDAHGVFRYNAARLRIGIGEVAEAVSELESLAAALGPKAPMTAQVQLAMGIGYHRLGRADDARRCYESAMPSLPDDPVLLNNLAYEMLANADEAGRAAALAQKAVKLSGDDTQLQAYCLDTLGYAQFRAGLPHQALNQLRRSVHLKPMALNRLHLAEVLAAGGERAEAERQLEVARPLVSEDVERAALAAAEEALATPARPPQK